MSKKLSLYWMLYGRDVIMAGIGLAVGLMLTAVF
mgnify:CR=1 FL=1